MRYPRFFALAVLLLVPATLLRAQTAMGAGDAQPRLTRGSQIRVVYEADSLRPSHSVSGSLLRLHNDSALIAVGLAPPEVVVLRPHMHVEMATGSRDAAGAGALMGAILGTAAVAMASSGGPCNYYCPSPVATGVILGAPLGALVGYVIGRSFRTYTWTPVIPPPSLDAAARGTEVPLARTGLAP